jgi:hypothetical protein
MNPAARKEIHYPSDTRLLLQPLRAQDIELTSPPVNRKRGVFGVHSKDPGQPTQRVHVFAYETSWGNSSANRIHKHIGRRLAGLQQDLPALQAR